MDYNTLSYNQYRFPFSDTHTEFLTPSNQVKFINDFKNRRYGMNVSWDGGKTYQWDTPDSMVEIDLFLSDQRIELTYRVQTVLDIAAQFGGLMGSFMLIFTVVGNYMNKQCLLGKSLE
jgi:hypothetical protein